MPEMQEMMQTAAMAGALPPMLPEENRWGKRVLLTLLLAELLGGDAGDIFTGLLSVQKSSR